MKTNSLKLLEVLCFHLIVLLVVTTANVTVYPGEGKFYSDHGGFLNLCPVQSCDPSRCNMGFFLSRCGGNFSGICAPCNNSKPANSDYSTRGGLISDCEWSCVAGYTVYQGACASTSSCSKPKPTNSDYSSAAPECDHKCNAGYFNSLTAINPTSCTSCQEGSFSNVGATICTNCQAGTFSTVSASPNIQNCQQCLAGRYSTTSGASISSVCRTCQAGTYSSKLGASTASDCQGCSPGTASSSEGATNIGTCVQCGTGRFTNTTAQTSCIECARGTYVSTSGATKCFNCDPNTYADRTGMSACSLCEYCSFGNFRSGCGPISEGFCASCSNPLVS